MLGSHVAFGRYFPPMRNVLWNAFSLGAVISVGACAAGSVVQGVPSSTTTTTSTTPREVDSGDPPTNGSEDSGAVATPPSEDSGAVTPPSQDSGAITPPTNDSGTTPPSDDSGAQASDDAGPPANTTSCPNTVAYGIAWAGVSGTEPVCATNSDCTSGQCCFVPTGLEVLGGPAACIPL